MNGKKILAINIDGTLGSGKTSQLNLLKMKLEKKGQVYRADGLEDPVVMEQLELGHFVINEGSIAREMTWDLSRGVSKEKVESLYMDRIKIYEKIQHKYGLLNIILILDDFEECTGRMKKEAELLSKPYYKTILPDAESLIMSGFKKFNNNTVSRQVPFVILEVDKEDSMLEVNEKIVKILKQHSSFFDDIN